MAGTRTTRKRTTKRRPTKATTSRTRSTTSRNGRRKTAEPPVPASTGNVLYDAVSEFFANLKRARSNKRLTPEEREKARRAAQSKLRKAHKSVDPRT